MIVSLSPSRLALVRNNGTSSGVLLRPGTEGSGYLEGTREQFEALYDELDHLSHQALLAARAIRGQIGPPPQVELPVVQQPTPGGE